MDDGGRASSPRPVCLPDPPQAPAPDYVGLSVSAARDRAGDHGIELRIVGEDGRCVDLDADLRPTRVNVEVVDGVVIAADRF